MFNVISAGLATLRPITNRSASRNVWPPRVYTSGHVHVLKSNALYSNSIRLPGGGIFNAHVFKAESSTTENPVMIVKGRDGCGTNFEVEVEINNLNSNSLSFVEMFAMDGYLRSKGKPGNISMASVMALGCRRGACDGSGFTKFSILPFY